MTIMLPVSQMINIHVLLAKGRMHTGGIEKGKET
jgi:hypothetical protein